MNKRRLIVLGIVALLTSPLWVNGLAALAELAAYGSLYQEGRPKKLFGGGHGIGELVPNASARGLKHSVEVNSYGMRGDEPLADKPDNALRIWTLGGSSTYDVFARRNETTWPQQLGSGLQAEHPELTVEVLNGGRPGEVLMGSVEQLEDLDQQLMPDLAVVMHGPNDLRGALSQHAGQGEPVVCDQDVLPPMDIALLRWQDRLAPAPAEVPPEVVGRAFPESARSHLRHQLESAGRVLHDRGIAGVFVAHPLRAPRDASGHVQPLVLAEYSLHLMLEPAEIVKAYTAWNEEARDIAQRFGFLYVDLASDFPHDAEYWGDVSHFSDEGSALAAQRIAAELEQAGLVRSGLRGPARVDLAPPQRHHNPPPGPRK